MKSKHVAVAAAFLSFVCAVRVERAAAATLLYQWDFDSNGGTGSSVTPAVTPNGLASDGGVLTMAGYEVLGFPNSYTGESLYSASGGGVSGASGDYGINVSAQTNANSNPGLIAYTDGGGTAYTVGTADTVNALPNVSQYTVTMWVNPTTSTLTAQSRLFMLGGQNTNESANSIWVGLNAGRVQTGGGASNFNSGAIGNTLTANTWNFIAVEVDLAASNIYYDSTMRAADGGAESDNVVLYEGAQSLNNYGYSANYGATDTTMNFAPSGPQAQYAYLLNNYAATRGFAGQGDDFRIYNGLLTTSQLAGIAAEAPVPEPATLGMLATAGGLLLLRRRTAR